MDINEKNCIHSLCHIRGLNGRKGLELIEHFGSAGKVFSAKPDYLKRLVSPGILKELLEKASSDDGKIPDHKNMNFTTFYETAYPKRLKSIPDPPLGIWYNGFLPSDDKPSVAVIGARKCSFYGEFIARRIGEALGSSGVQLISGMAVGIDGISQLAAISSGGTSFAVLGSGVDVCYPPSNRPLYDMLPKCGGVLSTYPALTQPLSYNFPSRNRIVSGLSDAVIVVEACQKSGTLITVDMALEQGREVYAVPGRISDRLSDGCNSLIGQGANIFLSPEIFLSELEDIFLKNKLDKTSYEKKSGLKNISEKQKDLRGSFGESDTVFSKLSDDEAAVYRLLDLTPAGADEISSKLEGYDETGVSMILVRLLIGGYARQVSQGKYVRSF